MNPAKPPVVGVDVRRNTWAPQYGISRYQRNLLTAMLALAPTDLTIAPVDLEGSDLWPSGAVLRTRAGHSMADRMLQEQVDMRRLRGAVGLLHLPWYEGPLLPRVPHVVSVLDLDTLTGRAGYRWRFRGYYNTLLRAYVRSARLVIAPSETTAEILRQRWPRQRYVVTVLGVDPVFSPHRAPLAIVPGRRVVLYTGGYGGRKRIDDLLTAFGRVADNRDDVDLVMSGTAPPEVLAAIGRSPARTRVHVTGYLDDDDLADLYVRASLAVYPTTLEGFGFPVVEAFASGTPVIATRAGSVAEIAGQAGRLVDIGDSDALAAAMLDILDDTATQDAMRAAGLARAREFSWETAARRTLDAYRAAL